MKLKIGDVLQMDALAPSTYKGGGQYLPMANKRFVVLHEQYERESGAYTYSGVEISADQPYPSFAFPLSGLLSLWNEWQKPFFEVVDHITFTLTPSDR